MFRRIWSWLETHIAPLQALSLVMLVLLIAGAFGLGAVLGNVRSHVPAQADPQPALNAPPGNGRRMGNVGAIESIQGDRIQLRDPRSGHMWSVKADPNTVVQFGPRQRIPLRDLRPGQRVFVVGVPNTPSPGPQADDTDWHAQFIGVVFGQPQRYMMPPAFACPDCDD